MILATAISSLLLLYAQSVRSSCANIARSSPSIAGACLFTAQTPRNSVK